MRSASEGAKVFGGAGFLERQDFRNGSIWRGIRFRRGMVSGVAGFLEGHFLVEQGFWRAEVSGEAVSIASGWAEFLKKESICRGKVSRGAGPLEAQDFRRGRI